MKKTKTGSSVATIELTRAELGIITYLADTSTKKLNKSERAFIQEIENIIKNMYTIEEAEKSIKGIFRK